MSPTWFIIKCLFMTFGIISILQLKIGSDSKTLEIFFTDWMKNLSASQRIQDIAEGGKALTTDVIKEFTTPEGHKIYIKESMPTDSSKQSDREISSIPTNSMLDSKIIKRLVGGLKLDYTDLNEKDQVTIKEQFRRQIEKEIRKDYESKLKKSGLDPKTLESLN